MNIVIAVYNSFEFGGWNLERVRRNCVVVTKLVNCQFRSHFCSRCWRLNVFLNPVIQSCKLLFGNTCILYIQNFFGENRQLTRMRARKERQILYRHFLSTNSFQILLSSWSWNYGEERNLEHFSLPSQWNASRNFFFWTKFMERDM